MSAKNFVSEKELEDEKQRRQEEWNRVRQPGQPEAPPEEPEDTRPLYDRLKQQRDEKQLEFEEQHKLKNLLRGLDSEEVGFLDYVDNLKREEEKKRLMEERQLMEEVKKRSMESISDPVDTAKMNDLVRKPMPGTSKPEKKSKQAQLLAGIVKKRKAEDEASSHSSDEKKMKADEDKPHEASVDSRIVGPATVVTGIRLSATRRVGILPGLATYADDSSDDSSNSDDVNECIMYTNPVQLKLDRQAAQKQVDTATKHAQCE